MYTVGRFLQLFGLILTPMALLYYATNRDRVSEAKLMAGELSILMAGGACFLIGSALIRRSA